MKYTIHRTVSPHDLDYNNIASASAVLRFMQECAYMQLTDVPPTMDELREQGKVFVLSRLSYSIYSELHACEEIEIRTWPCESGGVSFPRCSQIIRDGKIVAELVSVWALINPVTHTLWRASDYHPSFEYGQMLELDLPTRIRIPRDMNLSLVGEHIVEYSDVDVNRHLNNTKYPDMLCGFLPDMKGKRVIKLAISYLSEAPLGERLKIYVSEEEDGAYWVRSVKQNGDVNCEAQIVTDEIS